jgi:hypothetical protein
MSNSSVRIRNLKSFYSITTETSKIKHQVIFDWLWVLLWNSKDNLLYNPITDNSVEKFLVKARWNIADILLWANFGKPSQRLEIINCWNQNQVYFFMHLLASVSNQVVHNIWYTDTLIVENPFNYLPDTVNSIAIGWAVADCAAICSNWKNKIIWISHVWRKGIKNQIIEQLIDYYKFSVWENWLNEIKFFISPMAWKNYEFEEKSLIDKLGKIFQKYNIDHIKDEIFIRYANNPKKWTFYMRKLIKRIFLEHQIEPSQIYFHPDDTTDINNVWPSYRLHSLWKKWHLPGSPIYNSRMWVFNVLYKKFL